MAIATIPYQVRLKPEVAESFRQAAKKLDISQSVLFEKIVTQLLDDWIDHMIFETTQDEEEVSWAELKAHLNKKI